MRFLRGEPVSPLPDLRPRSREGFEVILYVNDYELLLLARRCERTGQGDAEGAVQNLLSHLERARSQKVEQTALLNQDENALPIVIRPQMLGPAADKKLRGYSPIASSAPKPDGKRATRLRIELNDFERMALDRQQATRTVAYGLSDSDAIRALLHREEEELAALYAAREALAKGQVQALEVTIKSITKQGK